jgi:curved DNA-binding protein CbpA
MAGGVELVVVLLAALVPLVSSLLICPSSLSPFGLQQPRASRTRLLFSKSAGSDGGVDYYVALGVGENASDSEIKRAYRRAALKNHPDVSDAPDAQQRFAKVVKAYDVLKDSKKRSEYDRRRKFGGAGSYTGRSTGASYSRPSSSSSSSSARSQEDWNAWREKNPTANEIDDSFGKILGDILKGVAGSASSGRGILNDFVEFLENQVGGISGEGAEWEELLASSNVEELKAEAENAKLLARQLKRKVVEIGEERLRVEKELAEMKESGRIRRGRTMADIEAEMDLVDRNAGLKARYSEVKDYLKQAEKRLTRLQARLQELQSQPPPASPRSGNSGPYNTRSSYPHKERAGVKQLNPAVENELDRLKKEIEQRQRRG